MKNIIRYMNGGIFGMCSEYIYRVGFSIYPLIIMIIIVFIIFLDIKVKLWTNN